MSNLLEAVNLKKSFPIRSGWSKRVTGYINAVDDISMSLDSGQSLGLVGESGCGKSTLARLLVGLFKPTTGEVRVEGEVLQSLRKESLRAARRAVQMIFQDPMNSLNPRMCVEEIISEPLVIHKLKVGRLPRRKRVESLLESVQLPTSYISRLPRELSGGERQRVGIARALAVEPKVLICDEPVASLDVSVGAQILSLLRELRSKKHVALLFISHDLGMVASLCQRIAIMKEGRIVEDGITSELLNNPREDYTKLLLKSARLELDD